MMFAMTVVISAAESVPLPSISAAVHCLSSPGTAAHPAAGSPGHSTMIEMILVSDDASTVPSPLQSPGHTADAGLVCTSTPTRSPVTVPTVNVSRHFNIRGPRTTKLPDPTLPFRHHLP